MDNEIVTASIPKRVGACLLDLALVFIFVILLQNWVVLPISNATVHLDKIQEEYKKEMVNSGLYVEKDNLIYQINSSQIYDPKTKKSELDPDKLMMADVYYEEFITKFINTEYGAFEYKYEENLDKENFSTFLNHQKEESDLFVKNGDNYQVVENVDNEKLASFYSNLYQSMMNGAYASKGLLVQLGNKINNISLIGLGSVVFVLLVIIYLVFPLCTKNGKTPGKMILSLGLVSAKDGFSVSKWQIVIRFLSFFLIEVCLSIVLGGVMMVLVFLPLLISFTCVVFTKSHSSLHDFLAATIVVDCNKTMIYKNAKELKEHIEQIEIDKQRDAYYLGEKTPSEKELDEQDSK